MTAENVGIGALTALITLILLRVPIGMALIFCGLLGIALLQGVMPALVQFQLVLWEMTGDFVLLTLPLFIWMGQLAKHAGLGEDIARCVSAWMGRVPGGLAVTSVLSSAGFGTLTGSSVATVMTVGSMLLPEMSRYRYQSGLATGSIAAGGVLAILIPPSLPLVFYGAWTETSIGALFLAGLIPGGLLTLMFAFSILLRCWRKPDLGPGGARVSWRGKARSLTQLLPTLTVLIIVLGVLYAGLATPTEAAAVGVAGIMLVSGLRGRLTLSGLKIGLTESASMTANVLLLLLGGLVFSRFLAQTGLTQKWVELISSSFSSPQSILIALVFFYLLLGAFLDTFGMILLTLPFVFPLVTSLGYDPVWLGVFLVLMIELSLMTPPIGMNVLVLKQLVPDMPLMRVYRGVAPFVLLTLLLALLLIFFPSLALWLPAKGASG